MQNKYLINFSKKFWFWFWTKLMNGFAPSDLQGNDKRQLPCKSDGAKPFINCVQIQNQNFFDVLIRYLFCMGFYC